MHTSLLIGFWWGFFWIFFFFLALTVGLRKTTLLPTSLTSQKAH